MASGRLIDYLGEGLFSARPAAPDLAAGALGLYYATDTNTLYAWDGSAWDTIGGGGGSGAPITATTAEAGTTLTATGANAWNYTRFTNAGAKTYTFDSAETYANNAEYHGRNVGAGNLTIAQAGSFVITPPVGGSLVIPQGQSFFLKITGTNTADLILQSPSGTGPPASAIPYQVACTDQLVGTSTTSLSVTVPATAAVGDLLVAYIMRRATFTPQAGWTLAATAGPFSSSGTTQYVDIYYKTAVSGDIGASTTWTQSSNARMSVSIGAYRKTDGSAFSLVTTNATTKVATSAAYDSTFIPVAPVTATADNQLAVNNSSFITGNNPTSTVLGLGLMTGLVGIAPMAPPGTADPIRALGGYKVMRDTEVLSGQAQFQGSSSGSGNQLGSVTALFQ